MRNDSTLLLYHKHFRQNWIVTAFEPLKRKVLGLSSNVGINIRMQTYPSDESQVGQTRV